MNYPKCCIHNETIVKLAAMQTNVSVISLQDVQNFKLKLNPSLFPLPRITGIVSNSCYNSTDILWPYIYGLPILPIYIVIIVIRVFYVSLDVIIIEKIDKFNQ